MIYKILLPDEWAAFEAAGRFDGSPFDRSSGFVHLSSREQVGRVAARVFGQEPSLVLVGVDAEVLGDTLRWEVASDGDVYPHIYGPLLAGAVVGVHRVAGAASVDEALPHE